MKQLGTILLMILVVLLGALNNIAGKIRAVPLRNYNYFTSLTNAVSYTVFYGLILAWRYQKGLVKASHFSFVWRGGIKSIAMRYFLVMGGCDALGQILGFISQPYVAGPLLSLLSQLNVAFTAISSYLLLGSRYSWKQVLSILVVVVGALVPVMPKLVSGDLKESQAVYVVLSVGAGLPFAVSFAVKELCFREYTRLHGKVDPDGLDLFIVNWHASMAQLLLSPLMMPVNIMFGQTGNMSLGQYAYNGMSCMMGATPPGENSCKYAASAQMVYIAFNLSFNISLLALLRSHSALLSFVTIKAILPMSMVLYAIDLPLLGSSPPSETHIISFFIVVVGIISYKMHAPATQQPNEPLKEKATSSQQAKSVSVVPMSTEASTSRKRGSSPKPKPRASAQK